MRPASIAAVVLGLGARPVPSDPAVATLAVAARRDVPAASGRCRLEVGKMEHDLRVWLDDDRLHLAVLGPMGSPRLVVRSDGTGVALQQGPEVIVAAEAHAVLRTVGLPGLDDLAGLWVGRLPGGPRTGRGLPDGRAWAGQSLGLGGLTLSAIVHPQHGVQLVDVGPSQGPSTVSLSRSSSLPSGLPDVVRLHIRERPVAIATCTWTERPAPDAAFLLAPGEAVSLETLGAAVLDPLLPRVP